AASLPLGGGRNPPRAPPASPPPPSPTAPKVPTKRPPPPAASMPPLKSNEPPLWLRHLHWLLVLALIPLAMSLLQKQSREDDIVQRLDDTIENASLEDQRRIVRLLERIERVDLDDILTALPRETLQSASLC